MKTFREIAEQYQEQIEEAKFKKVKKWKADEKGNLKKILVKQCQDSNGQKAAGFKLVDGKKCVKISGAEKQKMKKTQKKIQRTKVKHTNKNSRRREKIQKKRAAKGL